MWIIRCAKYCGHVIRHSTPIAKTIIFAAPPIGVGVATALGIMLAPRPPAPRLPCHCHLVWVAQSLPMSPETANQVFSQLGDIALQNIVTDDMPGNLVGYIPPLPAPYLTPNGGNNLHNTGSGGGSGSNGGGGGGGGGSTNVPEPSSLMILLSGIIGIFAFRKIRK